LEVITMYSCLPTLDTASAVNLCIASPRPVEHITATLYAVTRQAPGGVNQQAIAAIENALLDVKAKALGIPVYSLFGGPVRQKLPLYWSHCGGYRVRNPDILGVDPVPQQTVDANVERPALYRFLPKISLDSWRCRRPPTWYFLPFAPVHLALEYRNK